MLETLKGYLMKRRFLPVIAVFSLGLFGCQNLKNASIPPTNIDTKKHSVHLAVNGPLMRGFDFNKNLTDVNAEFIREAKTKSVYKMYSISDIHPAMYKVSEGGNELTVEIWAFDSEGLVSVLRKEPEGLCIGKIELSNGEVVLGVLGEEIICNGMKEITEYGGWREYMTQFKR